ncbi:MAG: hypothetical protein MJA83_00650 [Gammaproteobacteria bacterium]|nr:hypothetical protein [Gammaproteobacteria bacterium]
MAVSLIQLWLPILIGAALAWTVGALPGLYHIPHCKDPLEMADEAMQQKMKEGPAP